MSPRNEDFLFAQEAQRQGFVDDAQIDQGFRLQQRMNEELQLDERLSVILVKRGWMAEKQARRVYARLEPKGRRDEIEGYDIIEKLGSGSMGTVYKAMHRALGRPVAIKILRRELAKDSIHVERLKEEAKLLASLDHPNIVRALDAGESGGFPFVVMEFVHGESLKDRVARRGPLPEVDALKITRAVADALERARRMGVVHRDVKPGNIVLSRQGDPKLMDLGLAKGPVDLGLTQHGATVGTPQFISPEQAQDPRRADTRSDIYSLGATLYAMLSGRPPFSGRTLAEVISKVLYQEPTPLRVLNRDVSPEAAYLVERMMLKDPALRYRTPAEVVRDIDAILDGRSIMPAGFRGNWEAHLLRRRYRRWTRIGAVGAVVLVVAAGALVLVHESRMRKEQRQRGTEAVATALAETEIQSAEDRPPIDRPALLLEVLQAKRDKARSVLDLWSGVSPERLDELRARVGTLDREIAEVRRFLGEVLPEVQKLIRPTIQNRLSVTPRYGAARQKLDAFEKEVGRPRSPAMWLVRDLLGTVIGESRRHFAQVRDRKDQQVPNDLDADLAGLREHATALEGDFVVDPGVTRAREDARRALAALQAIQSQVVEVENDYRPTAIRPRLDDFAFAALRRELEDQRRAIQEAVKDEWSRGEALGFGSVDRIWRHARGRLDALESALDEAVEATWRQVQTRVKEMVAAGEYEPSLSRLARFRDAAYQANYRVLASHASELYTAVVGMQEEQRQRIAEERTRILQDVREFLREGEPQKIRERVDKALARVDPTLPLHADLQGLKEVADAQAMLLDLALDYLNEHRRIEDVSLRNGTVDRRWVVEDIRRADRAVRVSVRGKSQLRRIAEVAPEQLARWATKPDSELEPSLRAVALLMDLQEEHEGADLRPRRDELDAAIGALEKADFGAALRTWAEHQRSGLVEQQDRREKDAGAAISSAKYEYDHRNYDAAYSHLRLLLRDPSELKLTDTFESKELEVLQLLEAVEAELANKRLAGDFPAATIRRDGEVTTILYDWESDLQLEIFRSGAGRACAAIESVPGRGVATPVNPDNHRLHLLRDAEGLVKDCPLVLPSIFDPAHPITVSFDLLAGTSPFFLAVDVDGLQVGVLSADPTSRAYRALWAFPPDLPKLPDERDPPEVAWYGRGRGVAFHMGQGFGDPTDVESWDWPPAGFGRNRDHWGSSKDLQGRLFAFEAGMSYKVRIERRPGEIALFVNDKLVAERAEEAWKGIGHATDADQPMRGGTGLIQLWTWTPMSIDDLAVSGVVLEKHR